MGYRQKLFRACVYLAGIFTLALGVSLNTLTGLGVSAVVSVPYSISVIWQWKLGTVTFLYYCACVALQFVIGRKMCKPILLALQIPMALLTSVLIGWLSGVLSLAPQTLLERFALLALAIICTGVGAAMIVDMELVPNPADALGDILGRRFGRNFGFGKNLLDALCVVVTCTIGLVSVGRIVGVQVGTVLCALLIGRVIALFNHVCRTGLRTAAGIAPALPEREGV